jgi:hypothetical protein
MIFYSPHLVTEKFMRAFVTGLATLMVIGGAAAAQPPKTAPAKRPHPIQAANPPAEIVLASAEATHVPGPASVQPVEAPPKPRVAPRVTTCRCGDPQVASETQEQ